MERVKSSMTEEGRPRQTMNSADSLINDHIFLFATHTSGSTKLLARRYTGYECDTTKKNSYSQRTRTQ